MFCEREYQNLFISKVDCTKMLSFGEKIAKINTVDGEIIVLQAIIKKDQKRKKKLMQAKNI